MTEREKYHNFVADQNAIPIFLEPWFLDAVCGSAYVWEAAIYEEDGRVLGVWPYVLSTKWGIRQVVMPPFLRQCGPYVSESIYDPELQGDILNALAMQLPNVSGFSQDLPYQNADLLPSHWNGFEVSYRTTYCLDDIHRQDETYKHIKSDYRKNKLPKAEKRYVLDKEVPLETFLRMHANTYKRQGLRSPAPDAYIRRLDAALAKHHCRLIIGARHKETGDIHAVSYLMADRKTCYLLASSDLPEFRPYAPSIFVIWHSILQAYDHFHVRHFDFLGSMEKKIASVRKQFGANAKLYLRIERNKWWLHMLKKVTLRERTSTI